jgi:dTDP-glucose 4,6-dehydratase
MGKTLVTGGAGFIGSNFVEKLFDEHPDEEIVVLDVFTYASSPENIPERIRQSPRFQLVKGNIRDHELVCEMMSKVDRVAHFAAESHVTRSITDDTVFFETDVMGTHSIANAVTKMRGKVKRFIHISTSEVYGTAESVPMTEDHALNPCTPYAAAKAGADRLVYAYKVCHDLPVTIIRPFNNYGPRQHLEKVVPRFITAALLGQPLRVHGNGAMTRDWLYVKDCCDGIMAAFDSDVVGETINLGTGHDTSVLDIAHMILKLTGSTSEVIHVIPRPGQVDRHISSMQKSFQKLGWWPKIDLAQGMAETVKWYKENPGWWERQLKVSEIVVTDTRTGIVAGL